MNLYYSKLYINSMQNPLIHNGLLIACIPKPVTKNGKNSDVTK